MTKLSRKTWKIRVLRYAELLPAYLYHLDPKSHGFRNSLKAWIGRNIFKDGDFIFKGKIHDSNQTNDEHDWLRLEMRSWQGWAQHDERSMVEYDGLI